MMNHKKSGWSGKVKVAMTIVGTIIFGGLILQCNAIIDEHAQELYGKSFQEISENLSTNEEHRQMYDAVRQGIP